MSKTTFKERMRKQREEEIIAAAGQMIREHGYAELNMDDLAEAVGVAKPTLYQHFKSKEDLVAQVIISAMERLEAHLLTPQRGKPLQRLSDVFRMLLEARHSTLSTMANLDTELVRTFIHTHPAVREYKTRAVVHLNQLVEEGKAEGEINPAIPTEIIVGWMFCSSNVLRAAYPEQDPPFWRAHLAEYSDVVIQAFISGIATRLPASQPLHP